MLILGFRLSKWLFDLSAWRWGRCGDGDEQRNNHGQLDGADLLITTTSYTVQVLCKEVLRTTRVLVRNSSIHLLHLRDSILSQDSRDSNLDPFEYNVFETFIRVLRFHTPANSGFDSFDLMMMILQSRKAYKSNGRFCTGQNIVFSSTNNTRDSIIIYSVPLLGSTTTLYEMNSLESIVTEHSSYKTK